MGVSQSNLINALYYKARRPNKKFKMSKQQFKSLFGISPLFYYYEYCPIIEDIIHKTHDKSESYRYTLDFIKSLISLFFSPFETNSYENEFSTLYAYLNIININRSQIKNKQYLKNKLFHAFLFSAPSSEEVVTNFRLTTKGVYYRKENINQIIYDIIDFSKINRMYNHNDLHSINNMLDIAYKYIIGEILFIPYYEKMDIYAYYFFHPLDYVNLYTFDRNAFYKLLSNSVIGDYSFMKKAYIYNYNLMLASNIDVITEVQRNVENSDEVITNLFNSCSTLQNKVLRDLKLSSFVH